MHASPPIISDDSYFFPVNFTLFTSLLLFFFSINHYPVPYLLLENLTFIITAKTMLSLIILHRL